MLLNLVICAAAVFALSALYFERRRRALEARMTKEVRERYAAYVELEQRVLAALGEFDCLETSFEVEIRKSREQIRSLEEALNAVEGVESLAPETPGGFLGVLDEGDANVQAQPITLTGEARDFEAELQHWERKVESAQAEKRNEIERQRQQITELTARVRQLEPSATALRQREQSLSAGAAGANSTPLLPAGELEQRIDKAESSARELVAGLEQFLTASTGGITNLRETLASCKPLIEQQARDRVRAVQLERERTELEKSCATLEERCAAQDSRLREREREFEQTRSEAAEFQARSREGERRLESAQEELNALRHDLENERQRVERESLAREELQRSREELLHAVAKLKTQLEEESLRSSGLGGQLDGARARLEQYEKQRTELEARSLEQTQVLQAQTEMLRAREEEIERLRARVGALETKLTSTRDSIGGQKSRLGELLEAIQVTQQEQDRHKALLSEQSAHIQEARELLELLRPAMDMLEGELDKKQPA